MSGNLIRVRDDRVAHITTGGGSSMRSSGIGADVAKDGVGKRALPPVFVMNPYYTGLGIARCLHGAGIKVIGLAAEPDAPGSGSRFFDSMLEVPNGRDEPEALCRKLVELGRAFDQKPLLLPTRDFDVLFIHDFWEALSPHYILTQPHPSPIMGMMDKFELARVAERLGMPTPKTIVCSSRDDLHAQVDALRFPVIMKPRFAYQWRKQGIWTRVGAQKAIIANTKAELLREYELVASALSEVLIQEFVPGIDSDIVVCCCYIDEQGALLGHFTARKLRQDPPLVGTGCAVEAAEIAPIVAPTCTLLRAFGYVGMAEVEYKYDRASGVYYLIEINPRHWDQHELGRLVGVNLSMIAYRHLTGHAQSVQIPVYRPGVRYRWIAERELFLGLLRRIKQELLRSEHSLLARVRGGMRALLDVALLLNGRTVFSVSKLSDPRPSARWAAGLVREVIGSATRGIGAKKSDV